MLDGDIYRRFIFYPTVFPSGIFDEGALFRFVEIEKDSVFALSLTSKNLLPGEARVHEFGCQTAADQNANYHAAKGMEPDPKKSYLGYYEIFQWSVTSLSLVVMNLSLRRKTEHGNEAHFELALFPMPVQSTKRQRNQDRRALQDYLAQGVMGPSRHICECDYGAQDRLNAIDVPLGQKRTLKEMQDFYSA